MPKYVQVQNKPLMVSDRGRVVDQNKQPLEQKEGKDSRRMVFWRGERFYVDELVLANFGDPPEKGRPIQEGETIRYEDGDKGNPAIDNIKYVKDQSSSLSDNMREKVINMLTRGETYENIKKAFAEKYDLELSNYRIGKVKKEFITGES